MYFVIEAFGGSLKLSKITFTENVNLIEKFFDHIKPDLFDKNRMTVELFRIIPNRRNLLQQSLFLLLIRLLLKRVKIS